MTIRKSTTARLLTIITVVFTALAFNASSALAEDSLTIVSQNNDEVVYINPGENIQSVINRHSAGTTFILRSGIHRMQTIRPRYGDTYIGEPNAIMNGSRVLTNWRREGNLWVIDGQTQQNRVISIPGWNDRICRDGYDRCRHPEDVFIDHEPLTHVTSLSQVGPGTWYFDYGANRIYIGDDPTGHLVETSVTDHAFVPYADNVTIRNIIVEKYANPVQQPAILAYGTYDWVVDGVTARLNHSSGIGLGNRIQILNSRAIRNGQIGIAGLGDDVVIYGNEIAYNNWANFNHHWEAGATKFVRTDRLLVSNNYVHNNDGMGLWTDIDNINVVMEDNIIFNNLGMGIFHEISYDAVIRNNIVKNNNREHMPGVYGAQIQVAESSNTEVYGNTVVMSEQGGNGIAVVNVTRGDGEYGEWWSHNNYVHNNTIVHLREGGYSGVQVYNFDTNRFWREHNNRFDYNTYYVLNENSTRLWQWQGNSRTLSEMNNFGQERNAQIRVGVPQDAGVIPAWSNNLVAYDSSSDVPLDIEVTALLLVDAETDQVIGELADGAVIDLRTMPNTLDVVAQTKSSVRSVRFYLNDQSRTESMAPYVLWGDDNAGDYYGWTPTAGHYSLRAVPYSSTQGTGIPGVEKAVNFTVVLDDNGAPPPVDPDPIETPEPVETPDPVPDVVDTSMSITGFTLIDADSGVPLANLADGDEINMALLPTRNLNIVAETSGVIGSVAMTVDDGTNRLENGAPYTVWGDENGVYVAWTPMLTSYTIVAVPHSERYAGGEIGEALVITVTFVDQVIVDDDTPVVDDDPIVDDTPVVDDPVIDAPVTEAPLIEQLILVNADTSEEIMNLADGMEIDLSDLPTRNLNVKAETANGVGSVMMSLNQASRMENAEPFALWGDTFWRDADGNYNAWTPELGTYTFSAVPYTDNNGRGTAGERVSFNVTFIDSTPAEPTPAPNDPPQVDNTPMTVIGLRLINADTDQPIIDLSDGQTINLDTLPTRNLNVEAVTDGPVESVRLEVNGSSRLENGAPYAVWGDRGGNYSAWTPQARPYAIRAVPYSRNNARGTMGAEYGISVIFINEAVDNTPQQPPQQPPQVDTDMSVTGFTLINADSNQPIMTLENGQTVNLATLPTRNLNMRVLTSGSVESVRVSYDSTTRVENGAPYAVWGDMNGNYTSWTPQLRAYTVTALPYGRNDGGGQSGAQMSITVTFVDQAQTQPQNPPVVNTNPQNPPTNDGGNNGGGNQPIVIPQQPGNGNNGMVVTGFTLINADTDQPIGPLGMGAVINLATLPTRNLNIRADVTGNIGSMHVITNDHTQLESAAPFSAWGDEPVGDYLNWTPAPGQYTTTAIPYSGGNFNGQTGTQLSITFTVTDTGTGATAITDHPLEVASACVGLWHVVNDTTTPVSFTYAMTPGGVRSAPVIAQPGVIVPLVTSAEANIYIYYSTGAGEVEIIGTANGVACQ